MNVTDIFLSFLGCRRDCELRATSPKQNTLSLCTIRGVVVVEILSNKKGRAIHIVKKCYREWPRPRVTVAALRVCHIALTRGEGEAL